MNKIEAFKVLHSIISGKPNGTSSTIKEYENLPPAQGLKKALEYLGWAKRGLENAKSDSSYWFYRGDEAVAHALVAIFGYVLLGNKELASFPDMDSKLLMNATSSLSLWAKDLLSDHKHQWEYCSHTKSTNKLPSHPKCLIGKISYAGLHHEVCSICGEDKYDFSSLVEKGEAILRNAGYS